MASFVLQILTGDAVGVQLNFLRRAGGDDPAAGLTAAGIEALTQMEHAGMVLDVSHLNDCLLYTSDAADD